MIGDVELVRVGIHVWWIKYDIVDIRRYIHDGVGVVFALALFGFLCFSLTGSDFWPGGECMLISVKNIVGASSSGGKRGCHTCHGAHSSC